jgi:predicted nucleic acid-binding protein
MYLIDANVFMYAAGSDHPNKSLSRQLLVRVASGEVEAAVDAEVLQEILHRYRSIGRWDDGRTVYDLVRTIVPLVIPITDLILDRCRHLMDKYPEIMARDALHAAAVLETKANGFYTFDSDFEIINEVQIIQPDQ